MNQCLSNVVDGVNGVHSNDPRARARFINAKQRKEVKQYHVKRRGYKAPDFARMILDLRKLDWTHEKIAFLLPVSGGSIVSAWATGASPSYENGSAFIELWQCLTGLERYPLIGEWQSYQYKIGQQDLFDDNPVFGDGGLCDQVLGELDEEMGKGA